MSAGFWSSERIQPRRGRQKAWARGSVRDSVAPPGLETSWDAVPTADAVGYLLSVLRTYGTPGPLRLRGFARKPTNPADFAGSREGRRGGEGAELGPACVEGVLVLLLVLGPMDELGRGRGGVRGEYEYRPAG